MKMKCWHHPSVTSPAVLEAELIPAQKPITLPKKKWSQRAGQAHDESPLRLSRKLCNTQVPAQRRHLHQPLLIQGPISSAKMKVSSHIHAIARNTSGAWTAAHPIWALSPINSLAHLVWCSTRPPIRAITLAMFSAQNRNPQLKGNCFSLG